MRFIIKQPNTDNQSLDALNILRTTGNNKFDTTMDGPRLQPILFGSQKCTKTETYYHNFVVEVATGCWDISETRVYFWGTHFYWLYDMKNM